MTAGSSHGRWNPLTCANSACSRKDHTQPIAHTAAVANSANRSGSAATKRCHRRGRAVLPGQAAGAALTVADSWGAMYVPVPAMTSSAWIHRVIGRVIAVCRAGVVLEDRGAVRVIGAPTRRRTDHCRNDRVRTACHTDLQRLTPTHMTRGI